MFEPRYLDLVRECGRTARLRRLPDPRRRGGGRLPATAAFGTEARIEDFGTGADGLLHLHMRGGGASTCATRVRDNGLMVADVDWCEPIPTMNCARNTRCSAWCCSTCSNRSAANMRRRRRRVSTMPRGSAGASPNCCRCSEPQRQALLQEDDPHARLDQILALVS